MPDDRFKVVERDQVLLVGIPAVPLNPAKQLQELADRLDAAEARILVLEQAASSP